MKYVVPNSISLVIFGIKCFWCTGWTQISRKIGWLPKYRTVNLYSLTPSMRSGYVFVFFLSLRAYIYSSDLITGSHSHRTTCNYNLYLSFRLETKFEHQMHNVMQYLTIISNSSEMIT